MAAKEKTHARGVAILGGAGLWARLLVALIAFGAICNIAQAGTLAKPFVAKNSPLGLGRNSAAIYVGLEATQDRRTHQENAGFLGELASDDAYATRGAAQLAPQIRLTQKGLEHIVGRHWASSGASKAGKFLEGTRAAELRTMIDQAVWQGTSRANTLGRAGTIFEHNFGRQIGVDMGGNAASSLRVVTSPAGEVITAFPF